jgi:hypothetical protein
LRLDAASGGGYPNIGGMRLDDWAVMALDTLDIGSFALAPSPSTAAGGGAPATPVVNLTFSAIDDANGLMYWLGAHDSAGAARGWQNPSNDALLVTASAATYAGYPLTNATDRGGANGKPALVQVADPVGAWVQWRIADSKRKLKPNYYVLHGNDEADSAQLRNWKLQGSNDGATWTDLDTRVNDATIGQNTPRGFAVADPGTAFSYFRILQTGANSDGTNWLAVGEIELYGELQITTGGGAVTPTDFAPLSLGAAWTGSLDYQTYPDGSVRLRGAVTHTGGFSWASIATEPIAALPPGARPARDEEFEVPAGEAGAYNNLATVLVRADGIIEVIGGNLSGGGGATFHLDSIDFSSGPSSGPSDWSVGGLVNGATVSYAQTASGKNVAVINLRGSGTATALFGWAAKMRGDFRTHLLGVTGSAQEAPYAAWLNDGGGHNVWLVGYEVDPGAPWVVLTKAQFEADLAANGLAAWGDGTLVPNWMP